MRFWDGFGNSPPFSFEPRFALSVASVSYRSLAPRFSERAVSVTRGKESKERTILVSTRMTRSRRDVNFYVDAVLTSCGGSMSTTPPAADHPHRGGSNRARFIMVSTFVSTESMLVDACCEAEPASEGSMGRNNGKSQAREREILCTQAYCKTSGLRSPFFRASRIILRQRTVQRTPGY